MRKATHCTFLSAVKREEKDPPCAGPSNLHSNPLAIIVIFFIAIIRPLLHQNHQQSSPEFVCIRNTSRQYCCIFGYLLPPLYLPTGHRSRCSIGSSRSLERAYCETFSAPEKAIRIQPRIEPHLCPFAVFSLLLRLSPFFFFRIPPPSLPTCWPVNRVGVGRTLPLRILPCQWVLFYSYSYFIYNCLVLEGTRLPGPHSLLPAFHS